MAKAKKKEYNLKKTRAKASARQILDELKGISAEFLINHIYFPHTTEFEYFIITSIEKQLILAILDKDKFIANLNLFYKSLANEIKSSGKIREFADFTYKAYYTLETKYEYNTLEHKVAIAYYDIIIEISTYLVPDAHFFCGVTTNGKAMYKKELYPESDRILLEAVEEAKRIGGNKDELIEKHFRRNGIHDIKKLDDLERIFHEERSIVNMHFSTSFLFNEHNIDIIKTPYATPQTNWLVMKPTTTTLISKENLKQRKKLLPKKGIYITNIENSNIDEILMVEKFALDKLFMIYRIKMEGEYFVGYYDVINEFFYSLYRDCSMTSAQYIHLAIENFILELYATLTTDIDSKLIYSCSIEDEEKDSTGNVKYKSYNRNDLDSQMRHVDAYIRKLPIGAVASEESKELAKKYGIVLSPNETFVRAFEKSVKVKK